jgi:acetyl-CoA C-acetyltransferase
LKVEIKEMTIQRQCASGMQAVVYGAQQIMLGDAEIIVAGGVELMSRAPYYLKAPAGAPGFSTGR